jgi:hypothetical protein
LAASTAVARGSRIDMTVGVALLLLVAVVVAWARFGPYPL